MRVVVFALVAVVATTVAARADEPPTVDDLLARNRIAARADLRPDAEREFWSVRAHGLDGDEIDERRGADAVSTLALGPFRTAHGEIGGTRWHQNENGETVIEGPEPSLNERVLSQTIVAPHDATGAWAVTTAFASGHATKTEYDARTMLVVRTERSTAGRTAWTAFDDFRRDARGRTRAWHFYGGPELGESDYDYRLVRDDVAPTFADSAFAVPPDRRPLVEFPADVPAVRLPARIENGRIYVRLRVAGRGLDFILDSGASDITIDASVARELGLTSYGRMRQTVAGTFYAQRAIVDRIDVGPLVMHDVAVRTGPIAHREGTGTRVVGLLGFDFIDALGLRVDFGAGTVDAFRPGTLQPPTGAFPLDVRLNSEIPVTSASVGGAAGDEFIVDTGAEFGLIVFQRFARAHPDAIAIDPAATPRLGTGVGGTVAYRSLVASRLALGPLVLRDADEAEAVAPNALGFDDRDGLLGSELLRHFTMYVDYASHRVSLAPFRHS